MKTITLKRFLLSCAVIIFTGLTVAAGNRLRYDSLACLEIEGKILNAEDGAGEECLVELYLNNTVIKSIILKEGKRKFKFTLSRNRYYSIRISKKGYISRLVCVDTKLLDGAGALFRFTFETELLKEKIKPRLNPDVIDFPVAIISFDEQLDYFTYNKEYSEQIRKELYKKP